MVQTNVATIGHADAGEAGRIVDAGGGVAAIQRHTTHGGQRHALTPATAFSGLEAALAALPPWGGDIHVYGDGVNDLDIAGGSGPGIVISKPNVRFFFHGARVKCSSGTRGFVVRAPRCEFHGLHFRSPSHAQAAFYAIRFEESVGSAWDCSGAGVYGSTFEFSNGSAAQTSIGAINAAGAGSGMQGLTIAHCQFIGLPGTQQTTIPHVSAQFHGHVPISLSFVEGFHLVHNVFRAERATVDAGLAGRITACAWIRDSRFGLVAGNSVHDFQGAGVDGTRGPAFRFERIASAEGHHTVILGNNMENAELEGLADLVGNAFTVLVGNMAGRNLGGSYGVRASADSQTGAKGTSLLAVGNNIHNLNEDLFLIDACDVVLVAANQGALMHPLTRMVRVNNGSQNVQDDPHSNAVRYKSNPT